MISHQLTISNRLGLHARAAAKLAATAGRFRSTIHIHRDGRKIDAKSVMSLMLLAAGQGTQLEFEFDGDDAAEAAEAVLSLITENFHEEQ